VLSSLRITNAGNFTLLATPQGAAEISLQLRVLHLGLLEDGNVGVGVFPEGQNNLLRQPYATQKVLEARVGAEVVNPQVSFEEVRDVG
jgi:hypothetical protein